MITDQKADENATEEGSQEELSETSLAAPEQTSLEPQGTQPKQLGVSRYVLAGFFAAGMAVAFLTGNALNASWNKLADNAWISQHVPLLTRIAEDDRPTYTTLVGAVVGVWATLVAYRREDVRTWTNEVAVELGKVTWPTKKEVTNSTVVVIVASAFATTFLALLDRFWSFVTNLVYGS